MLNLDIIRQRLVQLGALKKITVTAERAFVAFEHAPLVEIGGPNHTRIAPIIAQLPADVQALMDECERLRTERNGWERRARDLESLCADRL